MTTIIKQKYLDILKPFTDTGHVIIDPGGFLCATDGHRMCLIKDATITISQTVQVTIPTPASDTSMWMFTASPTPQWTPLNSACMPGQAQFATVMQPQYPWKRPIAVAHEARLVYRKFPTLMLGQYNPHGHNGVASLFKYSLMQNYELCYVRCFSYPHILIAFGSSSGNGEETIPNWGIKE